MRAALGVMARAPSAEGKTRLAPHLAPDRLHALRIALLSDTLHVAAAADGVDPIVFLAPGGGPIDAWLPRDMPVVEQVGDDLGRRMHAALTHLLCDGRYEAAMLIGTDVPLLDPTHIGDARDMLIFHNGVVVGPADDGGYYLIGMTRVHAALFENIAWSTGRVLRDTLAIAEQYQIPVRLLSCLYDVDTIEDLRRAERDLETASLGVAPNLRRFLKVAEGFSPASGTLSTRRPA